MANLSKSLFAARNVTPEAEGEAKWQSDSEAVELSVELEACNVAECSAAMAVWRGGVVAVLWFACGALHCGFLKGLDELEGERRRGRPHL